MKEKVSVNKFPHQLSVDLASSIVVDVIKQKEEKNVKQVAQRATIAHLSSMCQGQISFQKTYKWAMETRGLKSNSSELLCLSWLPSILMMIL